MLEVQKIAAQGDVMFRKVTKLPDGLVEESAKGPIVVAHSETGHHHSIDEWDGVKLFRKPGDPMVCFLQLQGVDHADVVHHRSFDTHETVRLLGCPGKTTTFEVRRQREYTPEGWRRVED